MSDSRISQLASLTSVANDIVNELDSEVDRHHPAQHTVMWLQIRLTQAALLADELKGQL